ncbi:TPA: hypothetical protein ACG5WP_003211 [Escherichia coli]
MTSDNIAEYVGENNQFTEKPVTEYPPVIQDNTVTTKDYLYSNNIDTDLLVVIGGLIVILFLMMLIMYFINSLRHKKLTEILGKISFPEKSGSNLLKPEAVSCNLLSLCVLAPVLCTPRKLAEVSREIIVASAQEIAWTPGSSRIDGHQGENITWSLSSQSPADKYDLINKTSRVSPDGTVAKLAMRQPFVLFKGLTFQKLCLPGAFRPGDHHNKMLRPGLCVVHASPQYL